MASKTINAARATKIYRLKLVLIGSKPPIWRRIEVADDITLAMLHYVLQIVMGWSNSHLHEFRTKDGRRYKADDQYLDDNGWCDNLLSAEEVYLRDFKQELNEKIVYAYDFGDEWSHTIHLESVRAAESCEHVPVCLAGRRACPPENCGGLWGYYDLLEAIKDPIRKNQDDMPQWADKDFDPETFDRDQVNCLLAELHSQVPSH